MTTYDKPCKSYEALNVKAKAALLDIATNNSPAVEDRGGLHDTNSGADFFEVSAWDLRAMLAEAYAAGQKKESK